ncbi:MAG: putative adenylate-forming enzyme [Verrucomicrobiales bacterium]|jgi:putative adenylate-forming enzyme
MSGRLRILTNYLRSRRSSRFRSRDDLDAWQDRKVVRHLRRIVPFSPYLQDRFGALPLESWRELPTIGKVEMMENFDRLNTVGLRKNEAFENALKAEETRDFSPTIGKYTVGLSSGTSSSRGLFVTSPTEQAQWAGSVLGKCLPSSILNQHRIALFLRSNSNLYGAVRSKRIQFEFFDLLKSIDEHVEHLHAYSPTSLVGPPSLLRMLAAREDLKIQPQRVISAAEVMEPQDREAIAARFGEPVHQIYQATEGFLGASRNLDGRIVLNEDLVVIEKEWIDREQRRFTPIITDFRRVSQPIIRYRLDDVLIEHPDKDSIFTVVERIEGRCDDVIRFGEATCFPDFIRHAILRASPEIRDYRAQQLLDGSLEIALDGPDSCQAPVAVQIDELARNLKTSAPPIRFVEFRKHEVASGRKLRRISRQTSESK